MTISNGYTLRIHNTDNWWGYNYFFHYRRNVYKRRAAWGMMNGVFDKIKRK